MQKKYEKTYSGIIPALCCRYMMFFQVPYLPEFLIGMNDCESFDKIHEWLPNNKPTEDEIEAYKHVFNTRGTTLGSVF